MNAPRTAGRYPVLEEDRRLWIGTANAIGLSVCLFWLPLFYLLWEALS